ncbi:hypothetical protein [Endozoicomonas sp. ALB115]|uniref:hypothetical protein n=1 Tax=Endozoicomonas sp. ALB115 TaxID=3403074 RepID=UPI003BB584E3
MTKPIKREHFNITTMSKKQMISFGFTEKEAHLLMKHRKVFRFIFDAEYDNKPCVDSRTLWELLGCPEGRTHYRRWFDKNLERFNQGDELIEEGKDYISSDENGIIDLDKRRANALHSAAPDLQPSLNDILIETQKQHRPNKLFHLVSLDFAKMLCMSVRGEIGFSFQKYFIVAEKLIHTLKDYNQPRYEGKVRTRGIKRGGYENLSTFDVTPFVVDVQRLICLHATGAYPSEWESIGYKNPQDWLRGKDLEKYYVVQDMVHNAVEYSGCTDLDVLSNNLEFYHPVKCTEPTFKKFAEYVGKTLPIDFVMRHATEKFVFVP